MGCASSVEAHGQGPPQDATRPVGPERSSSGAPAVSGPVIHQSQGSESVNAPAASAGTVFTGVVATQADDRREAHASGATTGGPSGAAGALSGTASEISPSPADPGRLTPESSPAVGPGPLAGAVANAEAALPVSDARNLVLIIWDIENVRLPKPSQQKGLSPQDVISYLKHYFIEGENRTEYRTCVAVTPSSLKAVTRNHERFVEDMVPHCSLLLASYQVKKLDADHVLRKELNNFVHEYAHLARARPGQFTIGLVTGDGDYLDTVQTAQRAGFAVELVHHENASRALLAQSYRRRPMLWVDLLSQYSQIPAPYIKLPYEDDAGGGYRSGGGGGPGGWGRRNNQVHPWGHR